jgi:glyoxylate reductase
MFMVGQDVHGATLGIVGAGRIGSAVARRAVGFGMPILYHNRHPSPALEAQIGAIPGAVIRYAPTLDTLLSTADVVVVMVPLTPETRGMFGAREICADEADVGVRQRFTRCGRAVRRIWSRR